jgi:hypothetical protein
LAKGAEVIEPREMDGEAAGLALGERGELDEEFGLFGPVGEALGLFCGFGLWGFDFGACRLLLAGYQREK